MENDERRLQRRRLGSVKGSIKKAKNVLLKSLGQAKVTGQMWVWQISQEIEQLNKIIANIEKAEKQMAD